MKFFKSRLFIFIITAIIFTGVGVLADQTISADKVNYSDSETVKDKLDSLYMIANTYVKLDHETTVSASTLLKDVTAYDSDGNLITGNLSSGCISGNVLLTNEVTTNSGQVIFDDFAPSKFFIYYIGDNRYKANIYDKSNDANYVYQGVDRDSINGNFFEITDNSLIIKNWSYVNVGYTLYYTMCK